MVLTMVDTLNKSGAQGTASAEPPLVNPRVTKSVVYPKSHSIINSCHYARQQRHRDKGGGGACMMLRPSLISFSRPLPPSSDGNCHSSAALYLLLTVGATRVLPYRLGLENVCFCWPLSWRCLCFSTFVPPDVVTPSKPADEQV